MRLRWCPLVARLGLSIVALALAIAACDCVVAAQTYDVGSGTAKTSQSQKTQSEPGVQPLGWGSNIQNARLARAAQQALQRGDHALALNYAQRASQAAPNDPQLWFLLAYAARLDGKLPLSADAYAHGLRLSPSSAEGLSGLAQTYGVMGRNKDAERLLKQSLSSDPSRRADLLLLGDLYLRSADYANALDWLGRAERMQPGARSELLLARAYQHMKQMDMADHYLDLAKRRDPSNPDVQRTLAEYYREVGNYSEAIAALKSIRNPKPDVTAELAYTYQLDGKLDESAKIYAQAANAVPKNLGLQFAAAQAEVAAGSIDKATPFLNRAAATDPNNYRLHSIRGAIAKIQEREQDAIMEYSAALASLPVNPPEGPLYGIQLHMELMALYHETSNDTAARDQLRTAQAEINSLREDQSAKGPFLRLRAMIRMNAGDLNGALADIREDLASGAQDGNSLQLNGDILIKLGRTDDAIRVYQQILARNPANRAALTSLGYASRAAGRDKDAEKYFLRLAHANPSSYVPYLALGDLYTAHREFAKAQVSYSKGYSLGPRRSLVVAGGMNAAIEAHNLTLAATWLSRVTRGMQQNPQILREKERYLSFKGLYLESAVVGRKAIKVLPHDRDVVVYLGYDLLRLGQYNELLALTSKYLTVLPNEPDIPLLEGYVHKHQGASEQAKNDFSEALRRDPNVITAYINRGYVFNDLHQPQAAADDFNAALKRQPDDGEAHLGLAYASLDLHKPQLALRQADLAERALGDSRDVHVIRATAYGRVGMLTKAAREYREALKFTPDDGALHLGLGNILFAQRRYHDAIAELEIAKADLPRSAALYALLARSYASLQDLDQTLRNVQLAEQYAKLDAASAKDAESGQSEIYVSTGQALSTIGDHAAAMERFRKALSAKNSDRVSVRLAIAQLMAEQGRAEDATRQIALAQMEGEDGTTAPPTGNQFIAAADVFRSMHDYELSQVYLQRAKAAGAPDAKVRIGLANNYLAIGDTTRAQAELAAVRTDADNFSDYQYLLAKANVLRQQHHNAEALTSFARAASAEGEDQTAEQAQLQAGGDEGLRITPIVSVLSDVSIEPIFEDPTVYVLDSKLDAAFPVPSNDTALLPPPRSSIETQWTSAFHLHLGHAPTIGGFFQMRNARGQISVPSTNSIVSRNTTDRSFNIGASPSFNLGHNVLMVNAGMQLTVRRDSESPVAMNQNLFRQFVYLSTSSFFNTISVSGYVIREAGPFTESNLHSQALTGALDFQVGAPWGKTALVTGWGATDQKISPVNYEDYFTSAYIGVDHRFSARLNVRAVIEDLRAWRVVSSNTGNAQNLRPAGTIEFSPKPNWNLRFSSAYSSPRSFHVYDAMQNGFSISYARPFLRKFNDDSGEVVLKYPIRFSAGLQEENFLNFKGGNTQQLRPYVQITLF